jgi:uncharacterized membrane protein
MKKLVKFGNKLADLIADFGGSWTYIIIYFVALFGWIIFNTLALFAKWRFDQFPFTFLNLVLGILASIQAPIIMMSQARQSLKDRKLLQKDYQLARKALIEMKEISKSIVQLNQYHKDEDKN